MTKAITCPGCGHRYSGESRCPECLAVAPGFYRTLRKGLKFAIASCLLFALIATGTNLLFIARTEQAQGLVIDTRSVRVDSGKATHSGHTRHTAVIEYSHPRYGKRRIVIEPVLLDFKWFSRGERVTVRYSPSGDAEAAPTTFWYFWNAVWAWLLIGTVFYLVFRFVPEEPYPPASSTPSVRPPRVRKAAAARPSEQEVQRSLQQKLRRWKQQNPQ